MSPKPSPKNIRRKKVLLQNYKSEAGQNLLCQINQLQTKKFIKKPRKTLIKNSIKEQKLQ